MTREFSVGPDRIVGGIGETERRLFQNIFASVVGMLEPEADSAADPLEVLVGWDREVSVPADPALRRLLPDGVSGNEEAALELRRLTERSVRQSKAAALRAASLMLDSEELRLSLAQAELLARALNDVRLVLAERLSLHSAEAVERLAEVSVSDELADESAAEAAAEEDALGVFFRFASVLQGALVHAMLGLRKDQQQREKRERKLDGEAAETELPGTEL